MSWDVIIINSPVEYQIEKIWEDNLIPSFGTRSAIQNKITSLFPETDWTDPTYAHLDNEIYVGHISIGDDEILGGTLMLHIYGGSNPLEFISSLCKRFNWTAYDISNSEYININNPSKEGWNDFQDFRQNIVNKLGGQIGGKSKYEIKRKRWWEFWK